MVRCTNCGHRWFVPHDATGGEPRDSTDVDRSMQAADDDTLDRGAVDQPAAPPPLDRSPELATGDAPGQARREPATTRSTGATLSWLAVLLMLLILTGLVLQFWGGEEVNPIAAYVIDEFGFGWTIAFKFGMMLLAIMMCEFAGRRNDRIGRRLAIACVLINAVPVVWTLCLLINAGPPAS